MTDSAVATISPGDIMRDVVAKGDLKALSPKQQAEYYVAVCESMGLNPLSKPFDYLDLNGRRVLYANKTCTDQLRSIRGISFVDVKRETIQDIHLVTVKVVDQTGREDMDVGAVNIAGLKGEGLANALMKALTKAKRRATLSICGLGWLDESELDSIPANRKQYVEAPEIGEVAVVMDDQNDSSPPWVDKATPAQMKKIQATAHDLGMSQEQLRELASVESLTELTKEAASILIDHLVSLVGDDEPEDTAQMMTTNQNETIQAAMRTNGWTQEQMDQWVKKLYNVSKLELLNVGQANNLIDRLIQQATAPNGGK